MKVLHILKEEADGDIKKIIEMHGADNEVKVIELYRGSVDYESLIADVFACEKVICW